MVALTKTTSQAIKCSGKTKKPFFLTKIEIKAKKSLNIEKHVSH